MAHDNFTDWILEMAGTGMCHVIDQHGVTSTLATKPDKEPTVRFSPWNCIDIKFKATHIEMKLKWLESDKRKWGYTGGWGIALRKLQKWERMSNRTVKFNVKLPCVIAVDALNTLQPIKIWEV